MSDIPSDADFARAEEHIRRRRSGLEETCNAILARFQSRGRLHDVYAFASSDNQISFIVFFVTDADIATARKGGVLEEIDSFTRKKLQKVGRGESSAFELRWELDSDENVQKTHRGNYFDRLR